MPDPVTLATIEPERLAALLHLLVDEGHVTPYASLKIREIVHEPTHEPTQEPA